MSQVEYFLFGQRIHHVRGAPALLADTIRGCGYDVTGIQRVVYRARKYILLCSVTHDDVHLHHTCKVCQHSIRRGARWCSLGCKVRIAGLLLGFCFLTEIGVIDVVYKYKFDSQVAVAVGGQRLQAAQRLVALAEGGHLAPAAHLVKTRFCTMCGLSFCHLSCPAPVGHHHPVAATPESIKTVVRFDGWAAVPAGQLPAHLVENVQA